MDSPADMTVRDPLAVPQAVIEARRHSMSERLELALNWNSMVEELRTGLTKITGRVLRER